VPTAPEVFKASGGQKISVYDINWTSISQNKAFLTIDQALEVEFFGCAFDQAPHVMSSAEMATSRANLFLEVRAWTCRTIMGPSQSTDAEWPTSQITCSPVAENLGASESVGPHICAIFLCDSQNLIFFKHHLPSSNHAALQIASQWS
ncbi:hypothetical protein PROFUN_14868, partial [Planoprotostelium fungivorum]